MVDVMDRSESLGIFSCMIRRLVEDFDELTKPEERRRFANSIGALIVSFDTVLFRDRQDKIEERLTKLEEAGNK